MSLLCRTGRGSHVNGRSGIRGYRDVFNSAPTIVGPPLRAKNYSISGHLRQNLFSANVLVALIRLWTGWASDLKHTRRVSQKFATATPQPTHGESTSRVIRNNRERPTHRRRSIRFAARDSQPAERQTKKGARDKPSCRAEASSVKQPPPEQGGVVSKSSLN